MSKKVCKEDIKAVPKKERKYTCKSCGAVAAREKDLCKPKKIK